MQLAYSTEAVLHRGKRAEKLLVSKAQNSEAARVTEGISEDFSSGLQPLSDCRSVTEITLARAPNLALTQDGIRKKSNVDRAWSNMDQAPHLTQNHRKHGHSKEHCDQHGLISQGDHP